MTQQHPITPPLELVMQWSNASPIQGNDENWAYELFIADQASKWAADQELEACCEWLEQQTLCGHRDLLPSLRTSRRPKPLSLKEQALAALNEIEDSYGGPSTQEILIRRALEQLPDNE